MGCGTRAFRWDWLSPSDQIIHDSPVNNWFRRDQQRPDAREFLRCGSSTFSCFAQPARRRALRVRALWFLVWPQPAPARARAARRRRADTSGGQTIDRAAGESEMTCLVSTDDELSAVLGLRQGQGNLSRISPSVATRIELREATGPLSPASSAASVHAHARRLWRCRILHRHDASPRSQDRSKARARAVRRPPACRRKR